VIAVLLLLAQAKVPVGAYGMPELCKLLTSATGVAHSVEARLSDYPVFVSVKSGDPARVRKLVAAAMHAEWNTDGGGFQLKAVKAQKDEGLAEFESQFKAACQGDAKLLNTPIRELYRMTPGRIVRYGPVATSYVLPLPKELAAVTNDPVRIRRMAPGVFETALGDKEIDFSGLSKEVLDLLAGDLDAQPISAEQSAAIKKVVTDPTSFKIDWSQIEKRDPIAVLQDLMLEPIAKAVSHDLVIALPDFSMFALFDQGGASVKSMLGRYSLCDRWIVVDDAAVACLTPCEISEPSQAKRSVLRKFLASVGTQGVAGISALSEYVSDQRPAASETWVDVMMLVMAGVIVDQEHVGDYPYNIRLYAGLNPSDWAAIRSGRPFPAATFSAHAQEDLIELLLQSRSILEKSHTDPAYWQTLDLTKLVVSATLDEKPVLIGFTTIGGEIGDAGFLGMQYKQRMKHLDHEPLYQPATRRKLTLTIRSPDPNESIRTGYSEIQPGNSKAVVWTKLPKEFQADFQKGLDGKYYDPDASRGAAGGAVGTPPPH
jgi:hypothetical protein